MLAFGLLPLVPLGSHWPPLVLFVTIGPLSQIGSTQHWPVPFHPVHYGIYPIWDEHVGQRTPGTSASNPNDISHDSNGGQWQASPQQLRVLWQWPLASSAVGHWEKTEHLLYIFFFQIILPREITELLPAGLVNKDTQKQVVSFLHSWTYSSGKDIINNNEDMKKYLV